jgi:2-dehydropantoate 2-reductase
MADVLLIIDGEVNQPRKLTWADFQSLDAEFQVPDVSRLDPKRQGTAVKLEGALGLAGVKPSAKYLTLHARADDFHASVPLASVRERGLLIYQLNGQPLPLSAGGPVRFYIPDFAACHSAEVDECANVKFVDRLELSTERGFDNRPEDERQHAELHERQS